MWFVDLKKAFGHVPQGTQWVVLSEYRIGCWNRPFCPYTNGERVCFALQAGTVSSERLRQTLILFRTYMMEFLVQWFPALTGVVCSWMWSDWVGSVVLPQVEFQSRGFVHEWGGDWQMIRCSFHIIGYFALVRFGEVGAQLQDKALCLQVVLHSCPQLWSQTLDNVQNNKTAYTGGQNEFCSLGKFVLSQSCTLS